MRIKVINPNTTTDMTEDICRLARSASRPDTKITCVNPEKGPVTIEGFYDESMAVPGFIEVLLKSEAEGDVDGYVIACFGDPGLYALRELTEKPVCGIAESATALAGFIAAKFSIVTIMPRIRMMLEELVRRSGAAQRLASIRTPDLTVSDFTSDFERCRKILIEEARDAVEKDYAEAIVLGCACMTGFRRDVEKAVGVPVIDAVASAVKMVEALVEMGLTTSKVLTYMPPEKKELKGMPPLFQP